MSVIVLFIPHSHKVVDAEVFKKVEADLEAVMVTIGLLAQALFNKNNTPIP